MRRRPSPAWASPLAVLWLGVGCAAPTPRQVEVGAHRVRLVPPAGWEVLEHGQQVWVRRGERAISLSDLGPAKTPDDPRSAPHAMAARVLGHSSQAARREIARGGRRSIQGREWAELETWDRVSHMNAGRVAFVAAGGRVLAVAIEHGPIEETGPAFEALLQTIEVTDADTAAAADSTR